MALSPNSAYIENCFHVKQEVLTDGNNQVPLTEVNEPALLVQGAKKETKIMKGEFDYKGYKEELYAGHVAQEELLLGPEVLQRPCSTATSGDIKIETQAETTIKSEVLSEIPVIDSDEILNGPVCNKEFQDKSKITEQILTHSVNKTPHICDLCGIKFKQIIALKIHTLKEHAKSLPFNCSVCKRGFLTRRFLNYHMQRHTDQKPYSCSICEQKYLHQSEFERHMKVHTHKKLHQCYVCNKKFGENSILQAHIKTHISFSCSHCQKTFNRKSNLKAHCLRVHSKEKLYTCDVCGEKYKSNANLKAHTIRVHTKQFPYYCHVCKRGFVRLGRLKEHIQTHGDVQPSTASVENFHNLSGLKHDVVTHHGSVAETMPKTEICSDVSVNELSHVETQADEVMK